MVVERVMLDVSDGTTMSAYVARPDHQRSHPGILVFQEAFGVNAHIRDVAERFAREGYIALAPELFHRTAPGFEGSYADFESTRPHVSSLQNDSMSADIRASYEWLRQNSNGSIVSIGFCMGGRASFLANATVPLKAAASFYGGGIAALLDRLGSFSAPMMMFWGGLDKHIRAEDIRRICDALTSAGKEYVSIEISNADHGFFCDTRASFNEKAARQSWTLVLEYFRSHLSRPSSH